MASGALHSFALIPEVTYGTTPANPAFVPLRTGGFSGGLTRNSFQSTVLRGDRQISDLRLGVRRVAYEVPIELAYGEHDPYLEGLTGGTWTSNVLKSGILRKSFTGERYFADLASGDKPYWRYPGSEVDSLKLQINADAMVTGTLGFMAQDNLEPDTAIITGATYGTASANPPFDSFTGTITEGGSAIAIVRELQLDFSNKLEGLFMVMSSVTDHPDIGRLNITGTLGAKFKDAALFAKFRNEVNSSLAISLTDKLGNTLAFSFPRIQYTGGNPDVKGEGTIGIQLPFQALLDTVTGTSVTITRTAHS